MYDRRATEESILEAVNNVLLKKGFSGLGINAVAREAGLSKVLIYRYFDNFDGLMKSWALKNSYWTEVTEIPESGVNIHEKITEVFNGQIDTTRNNLLKREVLRWLLAEETGAGRFVMEEVETRGLELTKQFSDKMNNSDEEDFQAVTAVLVAGINYLALMSDRASVFNGVPLDTDEGWDRIKQAVKKITGCLIE